MATQESNVKSLAEAGKMQIGAKEQASKGGKLISRRLLFNSLCSSSFVSHRIQHLQGEKALEKILCSDMSVLVAEYSLKHWATI